jgi:hypothetical protein
MEETSINGRMVRFENITDIVNSWPTRSGLADEISALSPNVNVSVDMVHKWAKVGSVPSKYHFALLVVARQKSLPLTAEKLIELHSAIAPDVFGVPCCV